MKIGSFILKHAKIATTVTIFDLYAVVWFA